VNDFIELFLKDEEEKDTDNACQYLPMRANECQYLPISVNACQ